MRLKSFSIENFCGYKDTVTIDMSDLIDELYGHLQNIEIDEDGNNSREDSFDNRLVEKGCFKAKTWEKVKGNNYVSQKRFTIQTYIRNKIHHPENPRNQDYTFEELKASIDEMRDIVVSLANVAVM